MQKDAVAVAGDGVAVSSVTVNVTMMCQGGSDTGRHQISKASYDPATKKTSCIQCGTDLGINPPVCDAHPSKGVFAGC